MLLLMGTVSVVRMREDAPTEDEMQCNTCDSHNVPWYFGTMTGTRQLGERAPSLRAQTVSLLLKAWSHCPQNLSENHPSYGSLWFIFQKMNGPVCTTPTKFLNF